MKRLLPFLALFFAASAHAQYWQQRVDFRISATLNDRAHRVEGNAEMKYVNNSPDSLPFLWIHCWPDAFKDNKTAFAKQLLKERNGRSRLRAICDKGWMDSLVFSVDGTQLQVAPHPQWSDVVKLLLPAPLRSGDSIVIRSRFVVQLPTYSSRSGHDGHSYMVCQWYPKPAVYDRKGWHPMPYLDRGEYYNDYGSYDVRITLPGAYVVSASGQLNTEDELARYVTIGNANRAGSGANERYRNKAFQKTLRFTAENVSDFAWFADKDFIIEHDSLEVEPGKRIDVFAFHHPNSDEGWRNSTDYIKDAVRVYSAALGPYAYPVVQAVEGPGNQMSGGMEYPMVTLITMPGAPDSTLDVVIAHEVGHNWFPMMVGSNERDFAWMDEGFNTWYEHLYSAEKYRTFGGANYYRAPEFARNQDADHLRRVMYRLLKDDTRSKTPINTPSADFSDEDDYGSVAYDKAALWLYSMEEALGKTPLMNAFRQYFRTWQFRHPYPEDFRASLEAYFSRDLSELFAPLEAKRAL
ncbi:MAG: M1 family peptidase [Chitinophagaceae bacterium]|nr:MAG: M1 family peptidase [Chitinophagaceae bacterium]